MIIGDVMKEKDKKLKMIFNFLGMTLGALVSAFALEEFLIPNSILDGGVAGISIIIHKLSKINLGFCIHTHQENCSVIFDCICAISLGIIINIIITLENSLEFILYFLCYINNHFSFSTV